MSIFDLPSGNSNGFTPVSYNYLDYGGKSSTSLDQTANLQNFLLFCNLQALKLKSAQLDDQGVRDYVLAVLPRGAYLVSCPLIIPELVSLDCQGLIIRGNGSGGTITSNYTGDVTTEALVNLYQPCVVMAVNGHIANIDIYANQGGTQGSGLYLGSSWSQASTSSIGAIGSGYSVNDVLTTVNPSKSPYAGATYRVTSVNGNGGVTGLTQLTTGYYALPPVLQAQQWTAPNGFNSLGTLGPQVFDSNGYFITTGGTGTGATINAAWIADWVAANTRYKQFQATLKGIAPQIGNIYVSSVGNSQSGTYGNMFACWVNGENYTGQEIQTVGGYSGIYLSGADMRFDSLNPVDAIQGLEIYSGAHYSCPNVVINSSAVSNIGLLLNNCKSVMLKGIAYNDNIGGNTGMGVVQFQIGANSNATSLVVEADLDFTCHDSGQNSGPGALATIAYVSGCRFNLRHANVDNKNGTFAAFPIASLYSFGSGIDASNYFEGQIDFTTGPCVTGSVPTSGINIYDAAVSTGVDSMTAVVGGTAQTDDTLQLTFTNPKITSLKSGVSISTSPTTGQTTAQMATALAAAINANSTLTALNLVATVISSTVTITQAGLWGTTVTKTISGSSPTETITLSPGSVMAGGSSGAKVTDAGALDMRISGIPSISTGFGKALAGSRCLNTNNGNSYIQVGSNLAYPQWSEISAPAQLNYATSRYFAPSYFSSLGTVNILGTNVNYSVGLIPIYIPAPITPKNLACEVTTGSSTGTFAVNMGIYADNNGLPGALILDVGSTATGVVTVAQAATGVQIQAIPSNSLPGGQSVLPAGWYWLGLLASFPTSGTPAFKAGQGNSAAARAIIGDVLTQGSASPNGSTGLFKSTGGTSTALPTFITSPSYNSSGNNAPLIWIGT